MKRILLIDDVPDFLELLSDAVQMRGWVCDTAGSVSSAKKLLEMQHYDKVCIDFTLGDGTAIDVLNFIQEQNIETHKVVLSGHEDEQIKCLALNAGAEAYITKGSFDFLNEICQ